MVCYWIQYCSLFQVDLTEINMSEHSFIYKICKPSNHCNSRDACGKVYELGDHSFLEIGVT